MIEGLRWLGLGCIAGAGALHRPTGELQDRHDRLNRTQQLVTLLLLFTPASGSLETRCIAGG